ncbi:MAG TPA: uroporphyrinogen-III synthase, partial [Terriglobales bacterium]
VRSRGGDGSSGLLIRTEASATSETSALASWAENAPNPCRLARITLATTSGKDASHGTAASTSNPELLAGLEQRGASVVSVPVYEWTLPEDTGPLRTAVTALVQGEIDVVMFTSSAQVQHLLQVARAMGRRDQLPRAFGPVLVVSIGPVTSEGLEQHGIGVDLEPSRPKMGFLVREAAERSGAMVEAKRRKH